jgi:hypothetical protein
MSGEDIRAETFFKLPWEHWLRRYVFPFLEEKTEEQSENRSLACQSEGQKYKLLRVQNQTECPRLASSLFAGFKKNTEYSAQGLKPQSQKLAPKFTKR